MEKSWLAKAPVALCLSTYITYSYAINPFSRPEWNAGRSPDAASPLSREMQDVSNLGYSLYIYVLHWLPSDFGRHEEIWPW